MFLPVKAITNKLINKKAIDIKCNTKIQVYKYLPFRTKSDKMPIVKNATKPPYKKLRSYCKSENCVDILNIKQTATTKHVEKQRRSVKALTRKTEWKLYAVVLIDFALSVRVNTFCFLASKSPTFSFIIS